MPALIPLEAEAELGREDDLVAPALQGAAQQLFVGERPVRLGGIEEGDAELERAVERSDGFAVVGHAVGLAHPHAAESQRGDLEPLGAEPSAWEHVSTSA